MNFKIFSILALFVCAIAVAEAHKKYYNNQPQLGGQPECVCDCSRPNQQYQPVLPNRPFYGSGGYHQSQPGQSIGYGGVGGNAVTGTYGSGGGQVAGGY